MPERHPDRARLVRFGLVVLFALAAFRPGAEAAQDSETAVLTEIRSVTLRGEVDFEIRVTGKFRYSLMELTTPPRLVLDLEPVEKRWPVAQMPVGVFGVSGVRVSQFAPRTTRVVFDILKAKPSYRVGQTADGVRVVFFQAETPRAGVPEEPKPAVKSPSLQPPPAPSTLVLPSTLFGMSVISFRLSDERFTEVFGSQTGWSAGFEFVQLFAPRSRVRPGLGVDYSRVSKSGFSTVTETPTSLVLDPVTVSGFLVYEARPVSPFLGAGVAFCRYRETSALHNTEGSTTGYSFQAGMFIHLGRLDFLKLKIFGRWTKAPVLVNGIQANLGGTALGLTVLAGFNIL